jgi:hypothetical protein
MAGKRQHYVPKFLQRGFLARKRSESEGEWTWWHFRGDSPKPLAITHIGVEEYFYSRLSKDGGRTLDDVITDRESGIQEDLTHARESPFGTLLDSVRMGRLVAHFVLRTAFIRSVFGNAAQQVVDEVIAAVGTVRGARKHLGIDDSAFSPHVASIVASVTAQLEAAGVVIPPPLAERQVAYALREQFDAFMADIEPLLARVQAELLQGLPTTVAGSHRKALAEGDHEAWEAALARLTWRTHAMDGVVLPDCIAIARSQKHDWTPLLLAGIEDLETCLFPLDDRSVLVGTLDPALVLDLEVVNAACAMCSDEFFIAAQPMPALAKRLGGRCAEVILTLVEDALRDLRSDITRAPIQVPSIEAIDATEPGRFDYTLHLPTLEDPAYGTALQRIVIAVVRELSCTLPLQSLDGITFAVDYPTAVAALDRGDPTLVPDLSIPRSYGVPVAKCVTVVRDGQRKQHLLFGWPIAEGLLSDQVADQHASLHTLTVMLAYVVHDVRHAQPLDAAAPPFPNDFTRLIYRAAAAAPGQYYVARVAAFADPVAGLRYAELLRDCVRTTRGAINAAHKAYAESGDVRMLLDAGLHHVGDLMDHAAQWCGHQDGLVIQAGDEGDAFDTGEGLMHETLAPLNLEPWLDLLHQDMRDLYDEPVALTAERLFELVRHVERVLWAFQMFPWPMADGGTYVTVITPGGATPSPPA